MWGFPRSKSRPEPRTTVRHEDTLEGLSELIQGWLTRMRDLLHSRELAAPPDRPGIDEQIDQLCREAAENAEQTRGTGLSERLQRMKQLTLDEMLEWRDTARRE